MVASGVLLRAVIGRILSWPPSACDADVSELPAVERLDVELPSDNASVCWVVRAFSRSDSVFWASSTGVFGIWLSTLPSGPFGSVIWLTVSPSFRSASGVPARAPFNRFWAFTVTLATPAVLVALGRLLVMSALASEQAT